MSRYYPLVFALLLVGCTAPPVETFTRPNSLPVDPTADHPVITLPLAPPLNGRDAELSGLDWYGDWLVLLPQYPELYGGALFALHRDDILAYLDGYKSGQANEPLAPRRITLDIAEIIIPGYEGYEAIVFDGDAVYFTIEVRTGGQPARGMAARLVTGIVLPDADGAPATIRLDPAAPSLAVELDAPTSLMNISDEALVVVDERVFSLYEANGRNVNPAPRAHVFSPISGALATVPFPTVEFRITDATQVDDAGCFWAINYFWPGERALLNPAVDALAATATTQQVNQAEAPANVQPVERLVEFCVGAEGIALASAPPIGLRRLPGNVARNWEGVARLDGRGFLLVTDQYPRTLLGFVETNGWN